MRGRSKFIFQCAGAFFTAWRFFFVCVCVEDGFVQRYFQSSVFKAASAVFFHSQPVALVRGILVPATRMDTDGGKDVSKGVVFSSQATRSGHEWQPKSWRKIQLLPVDSFRFVVFFFRFAQWTFPLN